MLEGEIKEPRGTGFRVTCACQDPTEGGLGVGEGQERWVVKSWVVWREAGCRWRGGHSIEIGPLNCFPEAESHALRGHDAVKGDQGTGICVVCILRVPPNVFPLCPWHPEPCPGHGGTRRSVFITVHALSYLIPQ